MHSAVILEGSDERRLGYLATYFWAGVGRNVILFINVGLYMSISIYKIFGFWIKKSWHFYCTTVLVETSTVGGTMKKRAVKNRIETLRHALHEMREKVIVDIEKQLGRELDPTISRKIDTAMDDGDWASLNLGQGVDYKVLEMRYRTYKDIADAFRRLETGTYGICERCGKEIPLNRLRVEPFARYCVPCLALIEEVEGTGAA
jgi:DnaK suppressor protein